MLSFNLSILKKEATRNLQKFCKMAERCGGLLIYLAESNIAEKSSVLTIIQGTLV